MFASPHVPPPLRAVYVYLTQECNQHCPHCWIEPRPEGRYRAPRPTSQQYLRFIDAAVPLGLRLLKLTGGEPLLREDDVRSIIKHASETGLRVTVETNGMLVDPGQVDFFRRHRVNVSVSLDGANREVHDPRRGVSGAFDRTWKALQLMAEAQVPLTMICAVSRSNLAEIPKILELLRSLAKLTRVCLKINPIVPAGRARKMEEGGELLSPRDLLDLASWVSDELTLSYGKYGIDILLQLEAPFFSLKSLSLGHGRSGVGHCGFLNLLSVLADGTISFCGIGYAEPELTIGNIRKDYDLPEIWANHSLLKSVRWAVQNGLQGVCSECLLQSTCLGGCRAFAYERSKSLSESPPWCQSLFDAGLFPESRLRHPSLIKAQSGAL